MKLPEQLHQQINPKVFVLSIDEQSATDERINYVVAKAAQAGSSAGAALGLVLGRLRTCASIMRGDFPIERSAGVEDLAIATRDLGYALVAARSEGRPRDAFVPSLGDEPSAEAVAQQTLYGLGWEYSYALWLATQDTCMAVSRSLALRPLTLPVMNLIRSSTEYAGTLDYINSPALSEPERRCRMAALISGHIRTHARFNGGATPSEAAKEVDKIALASGLSYWLNKKNETHGFQTTDGFRVPLTEQLGKLVDEITADAQISETSHYNFLSRHTHGEMPALTLLRDQKGNIGLQDGSEKRAIVLNALTLLESAVGTAYEGLAFRLALNADSIRSARAGLRAEIAHTATTEADPLWGTVA